MGAAAAALSANASVAGAEAFARSLDVYALLLERHSKMEDAVLCVLSRAAGALA